MGHIGGYRRFTNVKNFFYRTYPFPLRNRNQRQRYVVPAAHLAGTRKPVHYVLTYVLRPVLTL